MKKVLVLMLFEVDDTTRESQLTRQFDNVSLSFSLGKPDNMQMLGRQISRLIDTDDFWGVDIRGLVADQATLPEQPTTTFWVQNIFPDQDNASFMHVVGEYDQESGVYLGHRMFHIINPTPSIGDFIEVWINPHTHQVQRTTVNGKDVII